MGEDICCINEHCEFYDFMAHQNCGGDCGGEPAIASCVHSQTNTPPDTIESLLTRLAAAEQERDGLASEIDGGEFYCPECKSADVVEIGYVDDFGSMKCNSCGYQGDPGEDFPATVGLRCRAEAAEKERDELRTGVERLAYPHNAYIKELRDRAEKAERENERLAREAERREYQRNVFGQIIGELAVLAGIANDVPMTGPELLLVADGLKSHLTAAQQSAKEQFRAVAEKMAVAGFDSIASYRCSTLADEYGDGIELSDVIANVLGDSDIGRAKEELRFLSDHVYNAIREAAKEGR